MDGILVCCRGLEVEEGWIKLPNCVCSSIINTEFKWSSSKVKCKATLLRTCLMTVYQLVNNHSTHLVLVKNEKTSMINRSGVREPHTNSGHRRDQISILVAEAKLNSILYCVYTWSAVPTVQLINSWRQAGPAYCIGLHLVKKPYINMFTHFEKVEWWKSFMVDFKMCNPFQCKIKHKKV